MSKKKSKEKVVEFSKLTNKVAAVWTRVSTERQADTNGSLESQRRICTESVSYTHLTLPTMRS